MTYVLLPAIWLIVLTVGLPQLSETVYTPSLPDIVKSLQTSDALVEYTLTIYLFGFAIGTLFWGKLSDRIGRKPCVLAGLFLFILGCIGCYLSTSITELMLSRLVQALGGSIGSVLGQAICRDAFQGPALGRVYSAIGSALALFPALGPVVGGFIAEHYGWQSIFLFLIAFGLILAALVFYRLPETHPAERRQRSSIKSVAKQMLLDKRVIGFGFIVGGCNGIMFSYFAEGSFYLIEILGLSPSNYGLSFVAIAASTMLGGIVSKKLQAYRTSQVVMGYGLLVILVGAGLFSSLILLQAVVPMSNTLLIMITVASQMMIMFGVCMATSNALAGALVDYKTCIGTASSLFGFIYYCVIALFTFGMGGLHDDTLYPMPLYFLAIGCFMLLVKKMTIQKAPISLNA